LKTHLRSAKHRALIAAMVEARNASGLTQRALAEKLKRSDSFVWKFEAGERQLKVLEFIEIAAVLDVDPDKLLRRVIELSSR